MQSMLSSQILVRGMPTLLSTACPSYRQALIVEGNAQYGFKLIIAEAMAP